MFCIVLVAAMMSLGEQHRFMFCIVLVVAMSSINAGDMLQGLNEHEIVCRKCGAHIADVSDVFEFESNPGKKFTNPDGETFEISTFKHANVQSMGPVQHLNSFYEGHQWQVSVCKQCGHQIGWEYKRKQVIQIQTVKNGAEGIVGYSVEWALRDLKGRCLSKRFGLMEIEWCFERDLRMIQENSKTILGTFQLEKSTNYKETFQILGNQNRKSVDFSLGEGDAFKYHSSFVL